MGGSACNSGMGGGGGAWTRRCDTGAAAGGTGGTARGAGGAGSGAGGGAMRGLSASKGERGLPWTDEDTKRAMTSRTAEMDAAALWARSMAGSALVGRLLEQAAATAPTGWWRWSGGG